MPNSAPGHSMPNPETFVIVLCPLYHRHRNKEVHGPELDQDTGAFDAPEPGALTYLDKQVEKLLLLITQDCSSRTPRRVEWRWNACECSADWHSDVPCADAGSSFAQCRF